jgi:hypothetical protein
VALARHWGDSAVSNFAGDSAAADYKSLSHETLSGEAGEPALAPEEIDELPRKQRR